MEIRFTIREMTQNKTNNFVTPLNNFAQRL